MTIININRFVFCKIIFLFLIIQTSTVQAQTEDLFNYANPQAYEIGGIQVQGEKYLDPKIITNTSGLSVGDKIKIPGNDLSKAIKNLWKQNLFSDVKIVVDKTVGSAVFLIIIIEEKPRLSRYTFTGIRKGEADDLKEKLGLIKGRVITEDIKVDAINKIKDIFVQKGFPNADVRVREKPDTLMNNSALLEFDIKRNKRTKINEVVFEGNTNVKSKKLRKLMRKTKTKDWWTLFSVSKYNTKEYEEDKARVLEYYQGKGYKDAYITHDTVYMASNKHLNIKININEGNIYHLRNITWKGNAKYNEKILNEVFGLKKGDIYNQELIDRRLYQDPSGRDITTLYMDDGYLFFRITPTELKVDNDSIDLEVKIYEGPQATINDIKITGNTRTHEHVIRREIRTLPGQKFSRSDIIRSQRELANLGYFNPEGLQVRPQPNPDKGTVDIEYVVDEKPSDQLEMTLSYGGQAAGLLGTIGVRFTNFSLRNMFRKDGWGKYLPQGDGQQLGLRFQATGRNYQAVTFSFTEPWLGGKRPNSFSFDIAHTRFAPTAGFITETATTKQRFITNSAGVSLGQRLRWPDDYFNLISSFRVENYILKNYNRFDFINNGNANIYNISFSETLLRSSIDNPIFPKSGSLISLTLSFTPPYSLFRPNANYSTMSNAEKFKFMEYHKWRFKADWYKSLSNKFVLRAVAKAGFLGYYNKKLGPPPLERFQLGGDGISNFVQIGTDVVALRGYDVDAFSANTAGGANIFNKYTMELRFLLTPNPQSTAFLLAFAEGGNAWNGFKNYNPFDLKRTLGLGFRIQLPMFGLLGLDYGFGIDRKDVLPGSKFTNYGRLTFLLGFEPE